MVYKHRLTIHRSGTDNCNPLRTEINALRGQLRPKYFVGPITHRLYSLMKRGLGGVVPLPRKLLAFYIKMVGFVHSG